MANTHVAEVYYPSPLHGHPNKARGRVHLRLSAKQAVADPKTFELIEGGNTAPRLGGKTKFRLQTGLRIGWSPMVGGWRLDLKTLKPLAEAASR